MKHCKKLISIVSAAVMGCSMIVPFGASAVYTVGDVTQDGKVNAKDAAFILIEAAKRGAGQPTQDTAMEAAADVNNDHLINAKDASDILHYAALAGASNAISEFSEYIKGLTGTPLEYKQGEKSTAVAFSLDMAKQGNYTFNGELMVLSFYVNPNTPAGSYPIRIVGTDFASWEEKTLVPTIIDGEINVDGTPAAQADFGKDFSLKVNSASGKAGEFVDVKVEVANNPGFCGFITKIEYDKSALTLASTTGGKDFGEAVNVK
jgi:hypothetical protein